VRPAQGEEVYETAAKYRYLVRTHSVFRAVDIHLPDPEIALRNPVEGRGNGREVPLRGTGQRSAPPPASASYLSLGYQMIPCMFRFVCTNGMVCGQTSGEIRVPHKGDVVGQVIEGAYEGLDIFDNITESREVMKDTALTRDEQEVFARTALGWRYDENAEGKHIPLAPSDLLTVRRHEDKQNDLWTTYQRVQENMTKGGLLPKSAQGRRQRTRAVTGIAGGNSGHSTRQNHSSRPPSEFPRQNLLTFSRRSLAGILFRPGAGNTCSHRRFLLRTEYFANGLNAGLNPHALQSRTNIFNRIPFAARKQNYLVFQLFQNV